MKDNNYKVYVHRIITEDGPMYYVGVTKQKCNRRWGRGSGYRYTSSLKPYIDQYGWSNIEHYIVAQNLTYEDAKRYEDDWIVRYREIGRCINKARSGLISRVYEKEQEERRKARLAEKERIEAEKKAIRKEKEKNAYKGGDEKYKEYQLGYMRKKLLTPEGKIYNRVNAFNRKYPDRAVETPLEAKQKYIDSGGEVVPQYVKYDDL